MASRGTGMAMSGANSLLPALGQRLQSAQRSRKRASSCEVSMSMSVATDPRRKPEQNPKRSLNVESAGQKGRTRALGRPGTRNIPRLVSDGSMDGTKPASAPRSVPGHPPGSAQWGLDSRRQEPTSGRWQQAGLLRLRPTGRHGWVTHAGPALPPMQKLPAMRDSRGIVTAR
jgi:hypothetical protein